MTEEQSEHGARSLPIICRGLAYHIDYCPIAARVWQGKPYANVMDDCAHCQHQRGIEFAHGDKADGSEPFERAEGGHVRCAGLHSRTLDS